MAIYDTEEEQVEQLKKWWTENQNSVIAGVIFAVIIISGIKFWQHYQLEARSQASQTYQELLNNAEKNNYESVEKIAEKIVSDHSGSAYGQYATLMEAKAKVQKGDLDGAKAILENAIKTADGPEIKHVARIRLLELLLAAKQYEQGLQIIAAIDPASTEGFAASYDELQGDFYVAMDRLDEARTAYQSAIRTGQATPLVQYKLDDIGIAAAPEAATK